jgi:DNA repair exonuclease SbcCD ATPase subunit
MAAEEIVFKTRVETGDSAKKVDDVGKAVKGTAAQIKQLERENELLNGSMEEITLSSESLGKKFELLNKKIEKTPMTLNGLNAQMEAYKAIALQAGATDPIRQEAINKASELKNKYADLEAEVNRLAHDGQQLQGALQIGGAVAAGYGAAQGAMALFGGQSEELQKSLVKLQGVTALLMSLEQLRTTLEKESNAMLLIKAIRTKVVTFAQVAYAAATGATTGAMISLSAATAAAMLPLTILIAAIGGLIYLFMSFFDETENLEEANDKLTASYEKQNAELDRSNAKINREIGNRLNLAKAAGATEAEINKITEEGLLVREQQRVNEVGVLRSQIEAKRSIYKKAIEDEDFELAKSIGDQIRGTREKYTELKDLDGQYFVDKEIRQTQANTNATAQEVKLAEDNQKVWAAARDKRRQAELAEVAKRLELARLTQDMFAANIEDNDLRERTQLLIKNERDRNDIISKYGKDTELLIQLKIKQANEIAAIDAGLLEAAQLEQADKDKIALDKKLENEKYFQDQYAEIQKKAREDEEALEAAMIEAKVQLQAKGLQATQDLSDIFFAIRSDKAVKGSAEELKLAKQQFKVNKALQIAQAVMQGIQGVQAAFASGVAVPIIGPATGAIYAAAAGLTAIANVAKIKSTQFGGGGSGSMSSSVTPPRIQSNLDQTPNNQNQGQGNGTTNTNDLLGNNNNQNMKVIVVDSDIKNIMDKSAKVQAISTIE